MDIKVTGKNIEITDSIREYVEKKMERLEKFEGKNTEVNVVCSVEREEQIVEMQINHNGEFIRIEEKNPDLYASLDLATDRAERQMRKEKEKRNDKSKETSFKEKMIQMFTGKEEYKVGEITKTKCYDAKPISIDDAKLHLSSSTDIFLTYIDAETGKVNVLYKRTDGSFGIIMPE